METTLQIDGMSCGHCVARVKKALEAVPQVAVTDVQIGQARVTAEDSLALDAAIRALDEAGYAARAASA